MTYIERTIKEFYKIPVKEEGEKDELFIHPTIYKNAQDFEKLIPIEKFEDPDDPSDVSITPWGSVVYDLEYSRGLVSIEIGKTRVGYFTDFRGSGNYGSEGFLWPNHNLISDERLQKFIEEAKNEKLQGKPLY